MLLGAWLAIKTDLWPLRSSRADKKSSEPCGTSMGSQGRNTYPPPLRLWQPLPCSSGSSNSFRSTVPAFCPSEKPMPVTLPCPHHRTYLTVRLLAPIAPLGADSSSPPSVLPPAASIPSDPIVELLLSWLTLAGKNGLANPGTRKVRNISTTAASRNFFPVAPPM